MIRTNFLFAECRSGWCNRGLWTACIAALVALGALRTATDAEYTFASLALFPILVIAWYGGLAQGLVAGVIAASMWLVADLATDRHFSAGWVPWANAATRLATYGLMTALSSRVRQLLDHERQRALRDALTGVRNIRGFLEAGQDEIERAKRYSRPVAAVFIDLDNFKQLNDTRGHRAGDLALQAVAAALVRSVRATDRIGRVGGDEFAVLLPEAPYEAALTTTRKVAAAVNSALEGFPPVKASVGLAWHASVGGPITELLKEADKMMYEAKQAGGGTVRACRFPADAPVAHTLAPEEDGIAPPSAGTRREADRSD